uniref:Uncharacterized protein n=1 Tax=Oryza barthii TaxID=65489 RepID=A0A0D3HTP3_9ORYZ
MEMKVAAIGDKAVEEHLEDLFFHLHLVRGAGEVYTSISTALEESFSQFKSFRFPK